MPDNCGIYDKNTVLRPIHWGGNMARTKGATNRTPREIRKDGENQIKIAKLKEKLAREKAKNAKKR